MTPSNQKKILEEIRGLVRPDGPSVTVERACELLHCKRSRIFELLAEGRIERAPKFGRRTVILTESVLAAATALATPKPAASKRPPRRSRYEQRVAELSSVKW